MIEEAQTANSAQGLSAGNVAHATAACPVVDKKSMISGDWVHLAIITAYNDMLSAHQPYERYPNLIRGFAKEFNATTQVAGGVPPCATVSHRANPVWSYLYFRVM